MDARIFGISRLRTGSDGKGITTLVGFSDCPLYCKKCINKIHSPARKEYIVLPKVLLDSVIIDDIYFRMTGGGITFGGGEPLLQSSFIKEFIAIAPKEWHYIVETSLNTSWDNVEKLMPYISQWIIDIKDMNPIIYEQYTQKDIAPMKDNLDRLYNSISAEKILIRIPAITGYNRKSDIDNSIAQLAKYECEKEIFDYIEC